MKRIVQGAVVARSLLAWAAVLSTPDRSYALIQQFVHVSYLPPTGASGVTDMESFATPPDTPHTLLAHVGDTGYGASTWAGEFGNVAMEGSLFRAGSLQTFLTINSDEFFNPTVVPSRASTNFIIDGGELAFLAAGSLQFHLRLAADIRDPDGNTVRVSEWESFATLARGPDGLLGLTINGNDIGIHMVDDISARIPLSFQTFDIGIVPVEGTLFLSYEAKVLAFAPGFVEIIAWRFSDPLSIDGPGEFPTVTFGPVPEPASGLLLLAGSLLGLLRRRRRSPESAIGCVC